MLEKTRLKELLSKFPGGVESVEVSEGREMVATIVSESFRDCDEADRQERVWNYLGEHLEDADLYSIEFIFTNAPGEDTSEAAA